MPGGAAALGGEKKAFRQTNCQKTSLSCYNAVWYKYTTFYIFVK
jgi:hypothetical protein